MEINGLDSDKFWDYENAFYWFSPKSRIAKHIAHWEIYKKTIDIPGEIIEVGVFKGLSLLRWATFREILENSESRRIIGFDSFGRFPIYDEISKADNLFVSDFNNEAGDGLDLNELEMIFKEKKFENYELIKGDILKTIPEFLNSNSHLKISLLHLDVDIYKPTITALNYFWERLSTNGILIIDDYNSVEGATSAVDDFLSEKGIRDNINKTKFYSSPSYIIKS
tara:strand:+ start:645 stop:1316 length:672 start_codon:yes stop_codon:yes gene_type:complete